MPDERAEGVSPRDSDVEARFASGDVAAFEALFRAWQAEVFRWVVRMVRDRAAAEDVTAEAFWRAYRSRARFDPTRSFGAWMRRIATNAALDHLRRVKADPIRDAAGVDAGTGARVTVIAAADVGANAARPSPDADAAVSAAVRRLSPTLRVVVTLALVEERPYAEIADALGISISAVKVRVFRAVRALRRELKGLGVQP